MAYSWIESTPFTGAIAMFELKELLVSVGWTVLASGDGDALYGAASDIITSGDGDGTPLVPGSFANGKAWFRIQHPDGTREFIFQHAASGTNTSIRVKFSVSAGFTGLPQPGAGAIDETHTPSATDEVNVRGGGSDDVPTYATFLTTDNSYRWKAGADSTSPYNMWAFAFAKGGLISGNVNGCVWIETLGQLATGDVDGTWIRISTSNIAYTTLYDDDSAANAGSAFLSSAAPTPDDWLIYGAYVYFNDAAIIHPQSQATNPLTNEVELTPIIFGRRGAAPSVGGQRRGPGIKGVSGQALWVGNLRSIGSVLSTTPGARDYIVFDDIAVPWNGTVAEV